MTRSIERRRKAVLLVHDEMRDEDRWRVIVKVWSVPVSYFLGEETAYAFQDVDRLIADFQTDMRRAKGRPE